MYEVLVTGGNGFLGSTLINYFLDNQCSVSAIVRRGCSSFRFDEDRCKVFEYGGGEDFNFLMDAISPDTIVIHTASYYVAEHQPKDVQTLLESNIGFGVQVLEAMKAVGAKKIVNIGTAWQAYEGIDHRPVNLYAATKQCFEDMLEYYNDAYNFSVISLRLNDTYGEKDPRKKLVNLIISAGLNNTKLKMSEGNQIINITHVHDVCRAIYFLMKSFPSKGVSRINLRSEDELSLRGLVDLIEKNTGLQVPVLWGGRDYRAREVMVPTNNRSLNGFEFEINLDTGIKKMFEELYAQYNGSRTFKS